MERRGSQDHEVGLDQWVTAVLEAYQESQDPRDLVVRGVPGAYLVRPVTVDREVLEEYLASKVSPG